MLHDRQHGDRDVTCKPAIANRVVSLTWPASMEIYWNKRHCIRKEFHSLRIGLGHQHGRRDVM